MAWNSLKQRADLRNDQLQASVDLQRFLSHAKDLDRWTFNLINIMISEEKVSNFAKAQSLQTDHDALKGEIQAREESFEVLANMSTAMEQTGMYVYVFWIF